MSQSVHPPFPPLYLFFHPLPSPSSWSSFFYVQFLSVFLFRMPPRGACISMDALWKNSFAFLLGSVLHQHHRNHHPEDGSDRRKAWDQVKKKILMHIVTTHIHRDTKPALTDRSMSPSALHVLFWEFLPICIKCLNKQFNLF